MASGDIEMERMFHVHTSNSRVAMMNFDLLARAGGRNAIGQKKKRAKKKKKEKGKKEKNAHSPKANHNKPPKGIYENLILYPPATKDMRFQS